MPSVFLVSDTHFGHTGVCRFTRNDGVTKLRPWDTPMHPKYVPTITVKDPKLATWFALRWSS